MVRYHGYVYWIIGAVYLGFFVLYASTHTQSFARDLIIPSIFMSIAIAIIAAFERRYLINYMYNNRKEEWGVFAYDQIVHKSGIFAFLFSSELESDPAVHVIKRNNRAVVLVFALVFLTIIYLCLTLQSR